MAAVLALGAGGPAGAQDTAATAAGGWSFGLTPYVWLASLKGDVATLAGLPPVSVDADFGDIIENAEIALMLAAEARRGRFGIVTDLSYLALSTDGNTPGPLFGGAEVDTSTVFATVAGFYQVVAHERISLDALAGAGLVRRYRDRPQRRAPAGAQRPGQRGLGGPRGRPALERAAWPRLLPRRLCRRGRLRRRLGLHLAVAGHARLPVQRLVLGPGRLPAPRRRLRERRLRLGRGAQRADRRRDLLPNASAPIIVQATVSVSYAILAEAGLSFLGLGVEASTPTWGLILADSRSFISRAWWLGVFPGLFIMITVLSINFLGDALRDLLDVREAKDLAHA